MGGTDELARGFTYDALYRLLSATGRENQPSAARPWQQSTRADGVASTTTYTQRYSYDKLGNIQQLRHTAANSADSFTRAFDYGRGTTNYLQQVALAGAQVTYQYDASGNVTQENGSRHYQWDAADQLRQFATWTGAGSAPTLLAYYLYAGGQRVKKLTQTSANTWQVTVYVGDSFEHRYEVKQNAEQPAQTVVVALDGPHRFYQRRSGETLGDQRPASLYALEDHLSSAIAQTDPSGTLISREEYYPFGETSFGSHQKQRYRFCGKELDEESGLYYYGMRYYAAWSCRFVSVDPLAAKYSYYTPYQYAGNKPINFGDLDGAEEQPNQHNPATSRAQKPTTLRPNPAAVQDETARPRPRPAPVHQAPSWLAPGATGMDSHQAVMRPAEARSDTYEDRQLKAKIAKNIADIEASQTDVDRAMQKGVEYYGYIDLAITGVGLARATPSLVRKLASFGKAEVNTAGALVPLPGQVAEPLSWGGEFASEGRMVDSPFSPVLNNSNPGSVYQTRYSVLSPNRPSPRASIDSRFFTKGKATSNGGIRNNQEFWLQWLKERPETISPSNKFLIEKKGLSPYIDSQWIKYFPEQAAFDKELLIHHHVDFGPFAIPVPASTHPGSGGIWHTK